MSQSTDTTNAGCAENIARDLKEWADGMKAGFAFARDPMRSLELLACAPQGLALVLAWEGSTPDSDTIYRQNKRMNFVANLVKNDPLDVSPESDYKASPNETLSMLQMVDSLQERIMTFTPPNLRAGRDSDLDRVVDGGVTPIVSTEELPLRGYAVRFSFKVIPPLLKMRQ